jgi:hypothetical protein
MDRSVGVGVGAVAEGRKCWRRLFMVADRATVGLWLIEEKLGVAGSMRWRLLLGLSRVRELLRGAAFWFVGKRR